jgi:hypothetical protein
MALVSMDTPFGSDTVSLTGPTVVEVDLGSLADADGDGLEEIDTEIVSMQLTGTSTLLGPVTVRRRDPAIHPFQRSTGKIEERTNVQPGRLDLPGRDPPFCTEPVPPNCVGTTADSFFDVYFEVLVLGQVLHNHTPKHMTTIITHKPPARGETYEDPLSIPLFNVSEIQVGTVDATHHTPDPLVGGIADFPVLAGASAEEPTASTGGSGWSAGAYAALAAAGAAALTAIGAGVVYARRRWIR